ncbi:MAG: hypothetical protein NC121_02570 [Blautia sp.]|nr:hypothetical protein [Blautia sp.]
MELAVERAVASFKEEMAMTDDADKKQFLLDLIKESEAIDYDSIFQQKANGDYHIDVPYVYGSVEIDGKRYQTDTNGCYYLQENISDLEEKGIDLYKDSMLVSTDEDAGLSVDESTGNIIITRSLEELGEGIQRMGNGMKEAEGQVTIVTYPKRTAGQTYGNGVGQSPIHRDVNIVGCNKHDTDTTSINAVEFALQSSDCSMSVKLGVAYLANPTGLSAYWMSAYCVSEAISSEDGAGNAYCDGTLKNGRTNCSWFTGIGHTESFHTHIW